MSLGLGIFLVVVGAILRFALNVSVTWIDLHLVGNILMGAGAVIIILGIVLITRKRSSVTTTLSAVDPASGEQVTQQKSSIDDI
jgi:vacuolar-type H+-ATPase subunit I/STV1